MPPAPATRPVAIDVLHDFATAYDLLSQPEAPADTLALKRLIQTIAPELFFDTELWSSMKLWAKRFLLRTLRLDALKPTVRRTATVLPACCYSIKTFLALCSNPTASARLLAAIYGELLEGTPSRVTPTMTMAVLEAGPAVSMFCKTFFSNASYGTACNYDVQALICAYVTKHIPDPPSRFDWHVSTQFNFIAPDLPHLFAAPGIIDAIVDFGQSDDPFAPSMEILAAILSANPVHMPTLQRARLLSQVPPLAPALIKSLSITVPPPPPLPSLPAPLLRPPPPDLPPVRYLHDLPDADIAIAMSTIRPRVALQAFSVALHVGSISAQTGIRVLAHDNSLAFWQSRPAKAQIPWPFIRAITEHFDLALALPPNSALSPVILTHLLSQTSTNPDTLPFPSHLLEDYTRHLAACSARQMRLLGSSPYIIPPLLANGLYPAIKAGLILRKVPPEFWGHLTIPASEPTRRSALRYWFEEDPIVTIRALRRKVLPYSLDILEKDPVKRNQILSKALKADPDLAKPFPYFNRS